jgi:hypothetical protein
MKEAAGTMTSSTVLDLIDGTIRDWETSRDAARFVPPAGRTFEPDGDWEVTGTYSRAEAIADGVLIPVPGDLAADAGFRCPVALTSAAWEDCVAWTEADNERKPALQDQTGRLWDVIWVASRAIRAARPREQDCVPFRVYRVPRPGRAARPRPVMLTARTGPGDDGEQVVTITRADDGEVLGYVVRPVNARAAAILAALPAPMPPRGNSRTSRPAAPAGPATGGG